MWRWNGRYVLSQFWTHGTFFLKAMEWLLSHPEGEDEDDDDEMDTGIIAVHFIINGLKTTC